MSHIVLTTSGERAVNLTSDTRRLASLPRFYCSIFEEEEGDWPLSDAVFHHAVRVRRLKTGRAIVLFDGRGGEWEVILTKISRHQAWVKAVAFYPIERATSKPLRLLVGLSAPQTMDVIVEKLTELGVQECLPIYSTYSARFSSAEILEKRMLHWQGVAVAACEQCGRNTLPILDQPCPFSEALSSLPSESVKILLSPDGVAWTVQLAQEMVSQSKKMDSAIYLLVGPEGGLTKDEEALAVRHGFLPITIASTILRVETAVVSRLSLASLLFHC